MLQPIEHADGANVPITGPAAKFSRTPTRVRSAAPSLGEHNADILTALGYDETARQQLVENGVINS